MNDAPAIEIQGLHMNFVAGRLSKLVGSGRGLQSLALKWLGGASSTPVAGADSASAETDSTPAVMDALERPVPSAAPQWLTVRTAVNRLDLVVPRGSVYGFLGQNGAGKTTTIKILTGLLTPTAGQSRIGGVDIRDRRCRQGLGYMPENPYFYEHLRPLETLDFYGRLYGLPAAERRRRGELLLREFGLAGSEHFQVRHFSKGMRQRLGLAQAVMADPHLVILDEPMSGLDPGGRREIKDAIQRLGAKGVTVFFSTHILSDVEDLCDRICLIHKGEKVAEGAPRELLDQNILRTDIEIEAQNERWIADLQALLKENGGDTPGGNRFQRQGSKLILSTENVALAQTLLQKIQAEPTARLVAFVPRRENIESYFLRKIGKVRRSVDALAGPAVGNPSPTQQP